MNTKDLGKGKTLYLKNNNELDKRFNDVFYVVEANSHEYGNIWRDNEYCIHEYTYDVMRGLPLQIRKPRFEFLQDNSGLAIVVGDFHGEPIVVTFSFFKLNNLTIVAYYPSSMTINYEIVEEWLKEHCNPVYAGRTARCDANNIHNCLNAVEDKTEKHQKRKRIVNKILDVD